MPFVLISTQVRLECGPTLCGDELSDPHLMDQLGAKLENDSAKIFKLYMAPSPPRVVLDKLATLGYRVVAMSGVGQTCIWTLFKEEHNTQT